jgi:hypothetical protein
VGIITDPDPVGPTKYSSGSRTLVKTACDC